ncbi:hypothetical protein ABZ215_41575 [Amycolatopsis sp. NPDC006131]|uniref:hypothetical protein n=1 Tax=Amycolatopsis sp. NPDC006131 TaxID=3156731 RepID=UPI0033B9CDEC
MTTARLSLPARWLLLAVVAFALVVMHHAPAQHVGGASHMTPSVMAVTDAGPSSITDPMPGGSDMAAVLHQCLAVFGQAAVWMFLLLAAVVFVRVTAGTRLAVRPLTAGGPDPPPRRDGRKILNSVCVLRL